MLDKLFIRKLNLAECEGLRQDVKAEQVLTDTRLSRLLAMQERNPGWTAYDKYADEKVDIGTYIEIQHAMGEDLEEDLRLLANRELMIAQEEKASEKRAKAPTQLTFFNKKDLRRYL